ncbi:uncharacterized protein KY384_003334 [Bacidia gigantensis]|uniref:uncharacterized protein n=1 Tax=Bacidia gigantensis TaxID=2732470 RepID=UPI001D058BE2|nr:uncharacterized protein KY384_003334 [Bacidia gigantensis]KAG8531702.1 hypothetical protein KY384_003334 [Bacidia gigantensis]
MEMVLTGREVGAEEAREWGLVNAVADGGKGEGVVDMAIEWAKEIAGNSPDSVVVSKEGVQSAWDGGGVEEATESLERGIYEDLVGGENYGEGLRAFSEKRRPRWGNKWFDPYD